MTQVVGKTRCDRKCPTLPMWNYYDVPHRRTVIKVFHWRQLTLLMLLSWSFGLPAQRQTVLPRDEEQFTQAVALFNKNECAQAEPILRRLHASYPANFQLNELLGMMYAQEEQLTSATPFLVLAVREQPSNGTAHANLGMSYLKLGHYVDAVAQLKLACRFGLDTSETEAALGQGLMLLNRPKEASANFAAAISKNNQDPDLLYNGALAFYDSAETAKTVELLSLIPLAETSPQVESLYGDAEEKLGHYKEAAQHYVTAARLAPTEPNVYALGIEFLRHWTFGPAVKEFEAGVHQFPASSRMRLGLGMAYYVNANYDRAISILAELLRSNPDSVVYAEMLGRTCAFLTEAVDPRCSAVIEAANNHPANTSLATFAAVSILHGSQDVHSLKTARQLLQKANKQNAALPEVHYEMALLMQTEGQWQQSIPELQTAIRLKPTSYQAHYRLGLAYSHTGRKDLANNEVALERKYQSEESHALDARLNEITTFIVSSK